MAPRHALPPGEVTRELPVVFGSSSWLIPAAVAYHVRSVSKTRFPAVGRQRCARSTCHSKLRRGRLPSSKKTDGLCFADLPLSVPAGSARRVRHHRPFGATRIEPMVARSEHLFLRVG